MKKIVLTTSIFVVALNAMTMQDAISKALNSYDGLKSAEYGTQAQGHGYEATRNAKLMPHISANYGYTLKDKKEGYSQTLQYGSTNNKTNSLGLAATMNVFNGFRDYYDIKSSKLNYESAKENLISVRENVKLTTKEAYIGVLKAKGDVTIAKDSLALTSKQLEDAKSYYKQGIIPKNELLQTEVQYAMKQQTLSQKASDLKIALLNLSNIINEKIKDNETFYFDEYKAVNVDENHLASLIDSKSDIKTLKFKADSVRAQLSSSKVNVFMPRVDISASYTKFGEHFKLDKIVSPSTPRNEKKIALMLTWNLFDGFADVKNEMAQRALYDSATMDLNKVKKDTMLGLNSSVENYKLAINNLTVMQKAETQAEENYRIVEHRYEEHIDNTTDLLNAELLLNTSKNNLNQTKYAVYLALARIERIVEIDF